MNDEVSLRAPTCPLPQGKEHRKRRWSGPRGAKPRVITVSLPVGPSQPARVQFSGQEKGTTLGPHCQVFSPFTYSEDAGAWPASPLSQGQKLSVASGLGSSAENSPPAESGLREPRKLCEGPRQSVARSEVIRGALSHMWGLPEILTMQENPVPVCLYR